VVIVKQAFHSKRGVFPFSQQNVALLMSHWLFQVLSADLLLEHICIYHTLLQMIDDELHLVALLE